MSSPLGRKAEADLQQSEVERRRNLIGRRKALLAEREREGAQLSTARADAAARVEEARKSLRDAVADLNRAEAESLTASARFDGQLCRLEAEIRESASPRIVEFRQRIEAACETARRLVQTERAEGARTGYLHLTATNYPDVAAAVLRIRSLREDADALALEDLTAAQLGRRLAELEERIEAALLDAARGLPADWVERELRRHHETVARQLELAQARR